MLDGQFFLWRARARPLEEIDLLDSRRALMCVNNNSALIVRAKFILCVCALRMQVDTSAELN